MSEPPRRLRRRRPVAPRQVRRLADLHLDLHVDRPGARAAVPDELLDVITGPFERAIGRPPRR